MGFINTQFGMDLITPTKKSSNGDSTILNPDEIFITPHLRKDIWKLRLNAMVKAAKDSLISQWAAPVILAVLLGFVIYDRTATNAAFSQQLREQHDLLVRLETLHEVEEKEKAQDRIDRAEEKRLEGVYREKMNTDFKRLELIVQGKFPKSEGGQ